jgi:hypothetical protein
MPTCGNITAGYTRSCENIASGIKNLWIANFNTATVWSAGTTGNIVSATSAPTFYRAEIREGTCSFTEDIVANAQFGSKNIRQNFELVIIGQGQSGRTFVNELLGARVVLGVQTEAGEYILAGEDKALEVNAGKGTAGVQAGEENTIRVTLSGLANEYAPTVASAYATTIFV